MAKPFDARELVARIRALIRREADGDRSDRVMCGELAYRFETREIVLKGEPLTQRRREHAVLEALILRQGKTV